MYLYLSFLGPFQVTLNDRPAIFATDRARALLAYLAVEGERPQRREVLADLLWPDRPESMARQNLSQSLARVRRAIDDYHADPPFLLITPKTVQFNISAADLDVTRFQRLLGTCAAHDHHSLEGCQACIRRLEQAAGLYQGDFLQGLSVPDSLPFEEWALFKREQFHRQALEALHAMTLHYEAVGNYSLEQRYAERQLALEPWRETAQRQLMRALALSGQRSAALAQYRTCCQILAREMGVEPTAETVDLYERIQQGELEPLIDSPHDFQTSLRQPSEAPLVPMPFSAPAPPAGSGAPFVGRQRELARLDQFLGSALAGRGQLVLLSGEAGSGKTALVREFAWRAQEAHAGLVVASGQCNAHTVPGDPYLPFREVLSVLTGEVEARWAEGRISQEDANRLWALAPLAIQTVVEHGPDLIGSFVPMAALLSRATFFAPGLATGSERGWLSRLEHRVQSHQGVATPPGSILLDQYVAVLKALAIEQPLVVLVEDLHWADASSISLLFHLGRSISRSRILLIATYRPEDVAVGYPNAPHRLAEVMGELKRDWGELQIDLDQMTVAEGRRFVDALVDLEPNRLGERFRQTLFAHTGGHALFTVELLRDMQEHGELRRNADGQWVPGTALDWERLPPRVEGVIERRLGRLPAYLRRALRVACVEGVEFTAEAVSRVEGRREQSFIRRLSEVTVRRHRLVEPPSLQWIGSQPLSRYRFRHPLFQQYLYQTLDEAEQRVLHGAVGRALEALYGNQADQIAVQLAWHFQAAGDADRARGYLLRAEERARRLAADPEGIQPEQRAGGETGPSSGPGKPLDFGA